MDDNNIEVKRLENEVARLKKQIEEANKKEQENSAKKRKNTKKALGWAWRIFSGKALNSSFHNWFSEFHSNKKVSAEASANLLSAVVRRFVRVRLLSFVLLLFSLVPSLVSLYILIKQNDLITTQNSLVEASRKSSYAFQLSNIYDKVDQDGFNLAKGTISRIIGITNSLKPYKILEENGLSEKLYSPEKSQLLLFLLNTELNRKSLEKIYNSADFSNCDLRNTNLSGKYLEGINLQNSNLENCELHSSNINEANLQNANLKNIRFSNGSAKNVVIRNANLDNAKITRVNLSGTNINSASSRDNAKIER